MNKLPKYVFFGIIWIIVGYFVLFISGIFIFKHDTEWIVDKKYFNMFNDSARTNVDTLFCSSSVKKNDVYSHFIYKKNYYVSIWEFKNMESISLDEIHYNQKANLDEIKFLAGEVLDVKSSRELTIKFGFNFNNTMQVNLDEYSKIKKTFSGKNYKGFYGIANRIALSDGEGEHQLYFDYENMQAPVLYIFYKKQPSFYVITIDTDSIPLDEKMVGIFKLD